MYVPQSLVSQNFRPRKIEMNPARRREEWGCIWLKNPGGNPSRVIGLKKTHLSPSLYRKKRNQSHLCKISNKKVSAQKTQWRKWRRHFFDIFPLTRHFRTYFPLYKSSRLARTVVYISSLLNYIFFFTFNFFYF